MAGIIIYMIISILVSLIFVVIGITQYKSVEPVGFYSGEKPPKKEELTDVVSWNKQHGKNWILFGIILFFTLTVFIMLLNMFQQETVQVVIFMICMGLELAWLVSRHETLKRKYLQDNRKN